MIWLLYDHCKLSFPNTNKLIHISYVTVALDCWIIFAGLLDGYDMANSSYRIFHFNLCSCTSSRVGLWPNCIRNKQIISIEDHTTQDRNIMFRNILLLLLISTLLAVNATAQDVSGIRGLIESCSG